MGGTAELEPGSSFTPTPSLCTEDIEARVEGDVQNISDGLGGETPGL